MHPAHEEVRPRNSLQGQSPEEYGGEYRAHLLEQYKLYVGTSQQISERRQQSNNYLLTLNSSLVALYVALLSSFGHHWWNVFIPVAGLFVCFIWHSLVESYKDLNTAKFAVIHELEEQLPAALFRYEWHVCGHGKDKDKYIPLTHLERWIPWMFGILYLALAIYTLAVPGREKPATPAPANAQVTQPAHQ